MRWDGGRRNWISHFNIFRKNIKYDFGKWNTAVRLIFKANYINRIIIIIRKKQQKPLPGSTATQRLPPRGWNGTRTRSRAQNEEWRNFLPCLLELKMCWVLSTLSKLLVPPPFSNEKWDIYYMFLSCVAVIVGNNISCFPILCSPQLTNL